MDKGMQLPNQQLASDRLMEWKTSS